MGVWCCSRFPRCPARVEPPKERCGDEEWGSARETNGTATTALSGDATTSKRGLGVEWVGIHVKPGAAVLGESACERPKTGAPAMGRGCVPVVASA